MLLNSYSYGVHLLRARYSKNCIIRDVESSPACIGSGQTLCHDIYPPRPITTVSLAANTYCMMDGHSSCAPRTVGPRVQFSGVCEQSH